MTRFGYHRVEATYLHYCPVWEKGNGSFNFVRVVPLEVKTHKIIQSTFKAACTVGYLPALYFYIFILEHLQFHFHPQNKEVPLSHRTTVSITVSYNEYVFIKIKGSNFLKTTVLKPTGPILPPSLFQFSL